MRVSIRFLKQYRLCSVGQVAEMDSPVADLLIQRGFAEAVEAAKRTVGGDVEAATRQPAEAAVRKRPRKRKAG